MDLQDWKIISTYTRAEAIKDGVQIAIPQEISREAGIKYPVFITQKVYNKYIPVPKTMLMRVQKADFGTFSSCMPGMQEF